MQGLRLLLLGMAVIVLAALGLRLTLAPRPQAPTPAPPVNADVKPPPTRQPASPSLAAARTAIEASLRTAPDLSRAFEALRAQFPAVATHALDEAAEQANRTGEAVSPDDLLANATRDLRQGSGVLAAKASPAGLGAIFDAKAAILAELAKGDPRVCADYLFGGTSPDYATFAASHRDLEAKVALAGIAATAEGRTLNQDHGPPMPDDFKALETGLAAKGLSADEIAALLDGKSLDPPLPDAKLCSNAQTYLDVLKALPDAVRLRLYGATAEALARS